MATYPPISHKQANNVSSTLDGTVVPDVFTPDEWIFPTDRNEAYTLFESHGKTPIAAVPLIETSQTTVFSLNQGEATIGFSVIYNPDLELVVVDAKGFFTRDPDVKKGGVLSKWRSPVDEGSYDKDYFASHLVVFGNKHIVGHVIPDGEFNLTTLKSGVF